MSVARWLCLLSTLGLPLATVAHPVGSQSPPVDLSLDIAYGETTLNGQDLQVDTTTRRLGVTLYEAIWPRLHLGIQGGYTHITQSDRSLTASVGLEGYYGGATARIILTEAGPFALTSGATFIYQRVDDQTDDQRITLEWQETRASLTPSVLLGRRLRLFTGIGYNQLDGEERARGPTRHTASFDAKGQWGSRLGLELTADQGGHVGIKLQRGAMDQVTLYFQRWF